MQQFIFRMACETSNLHVENAHIYKPIAERQPNEDDLQEGKLVSHIHKTVIVTLRKNERRKSNRYSNKCE